MLGILSFEIHSHGIVWYVKMTSLGASVPLNPSQSFTIQCEGDSNSHDNWIGSYVVMGEVGVKTESELRQGGESAVPVSGSSPSRFCTYLSLLTKNPIHPEDSLLCRGGKLGHRHRSRPTWVSCGSTTCCLSDLGQGT